MLSPTAANLFRKHAKISENCWLWTGSIGNHNYGTLFDSSSGKLLLAHRASFQLHHGTIRDGLFVLHWCDNTLCVNPDHLYQGNQKRNMQDRDSRGHHWAKRVSACPKAHPYDTENTRYQRGHRYCRECHRLNTANYRAKRKEASA